MRIIDKEWLDRFEAMDPDYVVDVLEITTEELICAFPGKTYDFYCEENNLDTFKDRQGAWQ
jgi:YHS domain-containing protein